MDVNPGQGLLKKFSSAIYTRVNASIVKCKVILHVLDVTDHHLHYCNTRVQPAWQLASHWASVSSSWLAKRKILFFANVTWRSETTLFQLQILHIVKTVFWNHSSFGCKGVCFCMHLIFVVVKYLLLIRPTDRQTDWQTDRPINIPYHRASV